MISAAATAPPYFNTEYPCALFTDANGPCQNFDIFGCQSSCFNPDGSKNNAGAIIINKDSDPFIDLNEINYGNRLQTYYTYVTTKELPQETVGLNRNFDIRNKSEFKSDSLLTQTPVYLQKTDMIKETMLFIFLDQGHDFHVAGERGNTMWTGVKGYSATMVYRPEMYSEIVEDEDEIPSGKSEIDDADENNSSISSVVSRVTTGNTQEILITLAELADKLAANVSPPGEIVIPYPYKNEYRNFAINTSFSGDIGVFGVMYMNNATYHFLLQSFSKEH